MRTESTKLLWCLVFLMSGVTAAILIAELKGFAVLPASQEKLIDRSWVSKSIVAVFVLSLGVNAKNTWGLWLEGKHLRRGLVAKRSSSHLALTGSGLLGLHATRMKQIYGDSFDGEVSQTVSLGAIRSRLYGQEWLVRVASQLLLMLGLIGTVLGLGNSLEGISRAMASVVNPAIASGQDLEGAPTVAEGFNHAVSGMATACATTLFGAILGGVFLKLLFSCTQYLADELLDEIEIITETQLVPLLRASTTDLAFRRRETLAMLNQTASSEEIRMRSIGTCLDQYSEKLEVLLKQVSRLETLPRQDASQGLNSVGRILERVKSKATQYVLPATLGTFFATLGWYFFIWLGARYMERSYDHRSHEQSHASDALADIALNTLGMTLILLLIFVVLFSKAAAQTKLAGTDCDVATQVAASPTKQQQDRDLTRGTADLPLDSEQSSEDEKWSGLWRFRVEVNSLVDHTGAVRPVDFTVDYFLYLDIQKSEVRGTLFGVKEEARADAQGSATHANINGEIVDDQMQIELLFTGAANGGSEIAQVQLHGEQFKGTLVSGKHKIGYQNYTGIVTGTRLDASAFGE